MVHTVIPHEHYVNTSGFPELSAHECSTTLFDDVKHTFGLGHGDGHLEQFVNVHLIIPELLLSDILNIVYVDDSRIFIGIDSEEIYTFLHLPPEPLRGPPC